MQAIDKINNYDISLELQSSVKNAISNKITTVYTRRK